MALGPENNQAYTPFGRLGHFEELRVAYDDSTVKTLLPFSDPSDSVGTTLNVGISSFGSKDFRLTAAFGKKFSREELSSGDTLIVATVTTPSGIFILTDIEDGFTVVNKDAWSQIRSDSPRSFIPHDPDVFFSMLNHQFTKSDEYKHWSEETVGIIKQLNPSIAYYLKIQNHDSPTVEVALKEVLRSYLNHKNEFRSRVLGQDFFQSEPGKELANGIFGVSGLFLPSEAFLVPEITGTSTAGSTIGGFAVCRSLADIGIFSSFPSMEVYLTDVNAFFDLFMERIKPIVSGDQFAKIQSMIYSKIDQLYAAFNQDTIRYSLAEEESKSGTITSTSEITFGASTDGGYYPDYQHTGDPRTLFLTAIAELASDPLAFLQRFKLSQDDHLTFQIGVK